MRDSRSVSALVVKRMAPAIVWRWMKVALCGALRSVSPSGLRRLDEIAEEVVVLDLELPDAGLVGVRRLQVGDDAAALVAQAPRFIERGHRAGADKPAVALEERQFVGERRLERRAAAPRNRRATAHRR